MQARTAHLVGSLPFQDEETAMRHALEILGPRLRTLPDPEIGRKTERHPRGERLSWIQWIIERFEDNPDFEMIRPPRCEGELGSWADYRSGARYHVRVPSYELRRHLDFGLVEYFERTYALFQRLRDEYARDGIGFQFGVPGALGLSLFSLGPLHGLRLREVFEDQLIEDCDRIRTLAGGDAVIQLEVPVELGMMIKSPRPLWGTLARTATGWLTRFVGRLLPYTRVGVHLCFGDLGNRPYVRVDSTEPLVVFCRELLRSWPPRRRLEYIHLPLAMANEPPSMEAAFYRPLRKLSVPDQTRLVAGFVHESLDDDAHWRILEMVEKNLDRTVGVASSCGLGRRSPEVALGLMRRTARLAGLEQRPGRVAAAS